MAESVFSIELVGLGPATKSLQPEMYLRPMNAEIKIITKRAQKTARSGFDSASPIINAIQAETKPLQGRMFSVMTDNRTASIEQGREPGDPLLHTNALRPWAKRQGALEAVFEIARGIQRRGVKGRFFIKAASDEAEKGLGRSVNAVAKIVVQKFPRFK